MESAAGYEGIAVSIPALLQLMVNVIDRRLFAFGKQELHGRDNVCGVQSFMRLA